MTTLSTGFPGFDECLDGGLHSDSLIVLAGPPASGKTSYIRFILKQALQKGLRAHLVDLEGSIKSTFKAVGEEARFSYQDSWSSEVFDLVREVDLLVVDNLHLAYVPDEDGGGPGGRAKWLHSCASRFRHPWKDQRAVTILTVQSRRVTSDDWALPARGLAYEAGVILYIDRGTSGTATIKLGKNRYGSLGNPIEFKLPSMKPFRRRTRWERLLEE